MKTIATAIVAVLLAGCSVSTETRTEIHNETRHHIDENVESFHQLVALMRRNSTVTKPSVSLKNEMNLLVFRAGLVYQCDPKYGCYLARPGFAGRIKIDHEFVIIDFSDRHVKIGDVHEATTIIYS